MIPGPTFTEIKGPSSYRFCKMVIVSVVLLQTEVESTFWAGTGQMNLFLLVMKASRTLIVCDCGHSIVLTDSRSSSVSRWESIVTLEAPVFSDSIFLLRRLLSSLNFWTIKLVLSSPLFLHLASLLGSVAQTNVSTWTNNFVRILIRTETSAGGQR